MKNMCFVIIALSFVVTAGCGSTPSTSSSLALTSRDDCKQKLGTFIPGQNTQDPGAVWIAVATVMTLGLNIAAYEACESYSKLLPVSSSATSDGIYHSEDGLFSVALPEPLANNGQPGVGIWRRVQLHSQSTFFVPDQVNAAVYGVSIRKNLSSDEVAMSNDQYADNLIASNERPEFDIGSRVSVTHLYRENVLVGDGLPAVMEVFREEKNGDQTTNQHVLSDQSQPTYLIYYISKTKGAVAVLSILWRNECQSCAVGPESKIRNMDPGIAKFVDTFKILDAH